MQIVNFLGSDNLNLYNDFVILEPAWIICMLETGQIPPQSKYIHKAQGELMRKIGERNLAVTNAKSVQQKRQEHGSVGHIVEEEKMYLLLFFTHQLVTSLLMPCPLYRERSLN